MGTVGKNTSYNFEIAKAVAILLVFTGHFGTGLQFFWIPVSVGLFVFGFSSAYFTSAKYQDDFALGPFWKNNLYRLGPSLLVINAFLLLLFVGEGRSGIWTLYTIVNVFGMTGFLNWFGLDNPSPFGDGLWFFTLLLLFYALYPVLRIVGRSRLALQVTVWASLVATPILQHYLPMGHDLWFTGWSFILGVCIQRTGFSVPPLLGAAGALAWAVALFALNTIFAFKVFNFYLILAIAVCVVLWLKDANLPARALRACNEIT